MTKQYTDKVLLLGVDGLVAETRSIKKAAPRLHTSHQNISKILHQMEDELGAELFIRSAKGLELTKAGQIDRTSFC